MNIKYLDQEIKYDGSQLVSHWIYNQFGILGDAMVSFCGPCEVKLDAMVDLEDVKNQQPIYSEAMLHFIYESFEGDLEKTILKQRLLISQLQTELLETQPNIVRKGDDLFSDHFKLTVSIATASPVSQLIHTGINISSNNTPVPTKGLADFDLNPQAFAFSVMNRFKEELVGVYQAKCKVRAVS